VFGREVTDERLAEVCSPRRVSLAECTAMESTLTAPYCQARLRTGRGSSLSGVAFVQNTNQVVHACALEPDLATMPAGLDTEVGVDGVSLCSFILTRTC
jgi:hypothetical protein